MADIPRPTLPPVSERPKIGELERKVFGPRKIYTLTVNMPNLTSLSGSWILAFSELNEPAAGDREPASPPAPPAVGPAGQATPMAGQTHSEGSNSDAHRGEPVKSLRSYLSTSIADIAARLAPSVVVKEPASAPSAAAGNGNGPASSDPAPSQAGAAPKSRSVGRGGTGPAVGGAGEERRLVAPFPSRKVDPKYPGEMMRERIEGEVVLYAVIHKDGTVHSVRVVRGLDPRLDEHAMRAFARWTFEPARVNGEPVELEALVHIPFRYQPLF
jgi:TonB family protein